MTGAMPRRGADLVIETLAAAGVRHLFTLSGNQILALYDATLGSGGPGGRDVGLIHTRHEAAAVHMADAWGRLTGQAGVALLTAGPGHANAAGALYGALMAESPVVLLSGHAPRRALGTGAFQEMDQVGIVRPVTKAAWLAEDAARLGEDVARALALACAWPPGPVHVSLPADLLEAAIGPLSTHRGRGRDPGEVHSAAPDVAAPLAALSGAERPLIVAGPAAGRPPRRAAVQDLAARTGIPALFMESPRGVDDPALRGAAALLAEADVVLLAGKALDFTLAHGRPPAFAGGVRFVPLPGDPAEAATALARAAAGRRWPGGWRERVEAARRAEPEAWAAMRRAPASPLHPLHVCAALQPHLDAGAVLVADGGEFGQWAQAGLHAPIRLINGPAGSIGSGLPMGIAARLAHPGRAVFVTLGDGTFGYHALELDTALRHGLPVVAVVGNDARWNAEHQLQLRQYGAGRTVGCALLPSRYDRLAEALGGHGEWVERAEQLPAALDRAAAAGRPACVNVRIEGVAAPTFRGRAGT
jgi:acetolactate synthase-1/2/3 large subunit